MSKLLLYVGSEGVGGATAHRLHETGHALHLVGRHEERLRSLAYATGASFTVGDVEDDDIFQRAAGDAGNSLAGLLFAVGTLALSPLARLTPEQAQRDFRINALGAAQAVQAALPALKAYEGTSSVVLFSSIAASQGFPFHASIAMAKGAVEGLTVALAAELAPQIRVNAIAPSLTRTPLARALTKNESFAKSIASQHPLKRIGTPEDAADLATFLLSDQSSWITGQVIHLDGGRGALSSAP